MRISNTFLWQSFPGRKNVEPTLRDEVEPHTSGPRFVIASNQVADITMGPMGTPV